MTPKRPYLLRAFYDWIVENDFTPYILVNALADEVTVPKQHIKDGKIVLNISPMAIQDFMVDNEALSFSARFGGVSFYIYCPMYSIEAIYAREAPTEGISFSPDEYQAAEESAGDQAGNDAAPVAVLNAVSNSVEDNSKDEGDVSDDDEAPPPKKRPSLRVVK